MKVYNFSYGFKKSGSLAQTIALNHYNRVIAAGGVLPCGLAALTSLLSFICAALGITSEAQFQATVPEFLDTHYTGYLGGLGSGTTLGQACQKIFNISGASGDVNQTTAGSQPLLLAFDGINKYYFQSGESGNSIQTPNAAANQITGTVDFDYCYEIQTAISSHGFGKIQGNGSGPSYGCFISTSGNVQYIDRNGNYTTIANVSSFYGAIGTLFYVRLTLVGTTATLFTSTNGITWTIRGTATVADLSVSNSSPLTFTSGGFTGVQCKAYRMRVYNGLRDSGGTLVADCNPNSYNAATSQTQWTSTTGEVWTINTGTAATGYKGVLVDRTIVQGDGMNDELVSGTITSRQFFTQVVALNPLNIPSSGGEYYVDGGGANGLLYGNVDGLIAFNGADLNFIGDLEYRLQIAQIDFNNTNSNLYINNSNNVSGATGTRTTNKVSIFSNGSAGAFGNAIVNTVFSSLLVLTSTQRTAVYNVIKTMNNL